MAQLAVKASPHMSWRRHAAAARGARRFAVLVAGFMVLRMLGIGPAGSLLAAGKLTAQDRVLVAAFDAPARDSALGDVVRKRCAPTWRSPAPCSVVPTSAVVAALEHMHRPTRSRWISRPRARSRSARGSRRSSAGASCRPGSVHHLGATA